MIKSDTQTTIVYLNTWANRCQEEILQYITGQMFDVDIFFFTEVTRQQHSKADKIVRAQTGTHGNEPAMHLNSSSVLIELMKDSYQSVYYSPKSSSFECHDTGNTFHDVGFGSLMAIRRDIGPYKFGNIEICNNVSGTNPRVLQWIIYEKGGIKYLAAHLHGVWIKDNTKGDDPLRTQQSEEVLRALKKLVFKHKASKVIFGGDLNLAPETEALAKLLSGQEPESLSRNLITEYGIESTRTPLYRHHGKKGESQLADYVLVSTNVDVADFDDGSKIRVSDHTPLKVTSS